MRARVCQPCARDGPAVPEDRPRKVLVQAAEVGVVAVVAAVAGLGRDGQKHHGGTAAGGAFHQADSVEELRVQGKPALGGPSAAAGRRPVG